MQNIRVRIALVTLTLAIIPVSFAQCQPAEQPRRICLSVEVLNACLALAQENADAAQAKVAILKQRILADAKLMESEAPSATQRTPPEPPPVTSAPAH